MCYQQNLSASVDLKFCPLILFPFLIFVVCYVQSFWDLKDLSSKFTYSFPDKADKYLKQRDVY